MKKLIEIIKRKLSGKKTVIIQKEVFWDQQIDFDPYLPLLNELCMHFSKKQAHGQINLVIVETMDEAKALINPQKGKNIAIIFLSRAMIPKAILLTEKFPRLKVIVFIGSAKNSIEVARKKIFLIDKESKTRFQDAEKAITQR